MGRILPILLLATALGCRPSGHSAPESAYPLPPQPESVGHYKTAVKSRGGYFYDEVLEYRVWVHDADGGDDRLNCFESFEEAQLRSRRTKGAEPPLVLVRRREWIDEPKPGVFERKTGERLSEWQVPWLARGARKPGDIEIFLAEHSK